MATEPIVTINVDPGDDTKDQVQSISDSNISGVTENEEIAKVASEVLKQYFEQKGKKETEMAEKTYTVEELRKLTPEQQRELLISLGISPDLLFQMGQETERRMQLMNQNPKDEKNFISQFISDHWKLMLGAGLLGLIAYWYFKSKNNNSSLEADAAAGALAAFF